jgi:hypothetical protein
MNFKILKSEYPWSSYDEIDWLEKEYVPGLGWIKATLKIDCEKPPNDFFNLGGLSIVSDNFVEVFRPYKDINVSFSPIKVIWNGSSYDRLCFYIMQVFDEVKCINYEESKYKCWSSESTRIMSLYELVTYPVDTDTHKLFEIDDTCFLGIDSSLGNKLINHGCSGVRIIDIADATI